MTDSETVLVTGGTGFIGSYLADELLTAGHGVVAFDAAPDLSVLERLGRSGDASVVVGDVTNREGLERVIRDRGVTRVVHLAALLGERVRDDPVGATRVNAVGVNNVLEAARQFPDQVERVVLASSETVYAPGSSYDPPVTESALLCPDSPYSAAKRFGETLAQQYRSEHGVSAVALRPTGVVGPYGTHFTEYAALFERPAAGEAVEVTGGETLVSWLSVADAADAFKRAALAPAESLTHDVYNVRGEVATVREAAAAVRDVVDDAAIHVADDADLDWSAQRLSLERARTDLGYEVGHDLASLAEWYVNAVRRDADRSRMD